MRPLFQTSIDRSGRKAGRWTMAGALMIGLHASGGAAGYVYWNSSATELIIPPATVIAFELAPTPVAPPPPQRVDEPEPVVEPEIVLPPLSELEAIPPVPPEVKVAVAVPEKPKPKKKKKKETTKKKKPIDKKPQPDLPPNDFKNTQEAPSPTTTDVPPQPILDTAPAPAGPTPDELARISNAKNLWMLQLDNHLKKYHKYPKAAVRKKQEGRPVITFIIDRQGNLLEAFVTNSSGFSLLDEAAIATLQRAEPLPPPPPEVAGERLSFTKQLGFDLTNQK
nr:energy transducer TonB [uncultured Dongia sp.]